MIKNLSGEYEIVEYENKRFVMLYDNSEYEFYPTHWHNAVEIIMPIENTFTVQTGAKEFLLHERDIIIIPPGELHTLPPQEGETADEEHALQVETVEDEYYVSVRHPMTKEHYISFVAYIGDSTVMLFKQYPEWDLQVTLPLFRSGKFVWYCTECGLLYQKIDRSVRTQPSEEKR